MAKVVILIGKTGSGKSTLANVISGTNKFQESGASISSTKEIQSEEFGIFHEKEKLNDLLDKLSKKEQLIREQNELTKDDLSILQKALQEYSQNREVIKCRVIDTVGIGDTKLAPNEVLDKIAEAVYLARNGISRVLFVIDGRFDPYEMSIYNLLRTIIFDEKVIDHTTIVRTNFEKFKKDKECKNDIDLMIKKGSEELAKLVDLCREKIIHVDSPPIEIDGADEGEIEINKNKRNRSREKLLKHLTENWHENYEPNKLKDLSVEIAEYMQSKIEAKKKLSKKKPEEKRKILEEIEEIKSSFNDSITTQEVVSNFQNISEESIADFFFENNSLDNKLNIKSKISSLENQVKGLTEVKKLKESIQKADKKIRQTVFNHIFNNIEAISQIIGAELFLNSIASHDNNLLTKELTFADLLVQRQELESKLLEKKDSDKSFKKIDDEIEKNERDILDLKKKLLDDEKILIKWQEQKFNLPQAQQWAEVLKSSFDPEKDADFCALLRDDKNLTSEDLINYDFKYIESLREEYKSNQFDNEELALEELLGEGDSANVYKGTWRDQIVAVKKIPIIYSKHISKEIKALKKLNHENIIQYYGEYSKDDSVFLIIEYAENGSLNKWIENNKSKEHKWPLNYNFIRQIVNGLNYLHNQGVIHRDLKSHNVLIANNNIIKLADFGLAKVTENPSLLKTNTNNGIVGTIRWMAPESIRGYGQSYAPKHSKYSDIYSLGMVIWEVCAKDTVPFRQFDNDAQLIFNVGGNYLKETIPNNTPQDLAEIINKCWEKEPKQRISLSEIENKLNNSENKETTNSNKSSSSSSQAIMNQLQLQFKIRDKSEELKLKISGLKTKLRSKSKFSVDKHQERENQLNNLFTKLPDTSDEFISELEKIKSSFLGKEITQEEINQIYLIKNELSNFQQEIQIQKGKPKEDENKELEIINSINNYLQVKQNFLSARQQTIEELKICLVELEKQFKKHETIGEIGNTVGNAGGAIPSAITFGIPKIIGEAIKATAKLSKISIAKQGEAEFKLSLENEEADITELNNAHISLTELLNQNSELGSQFQLNPKLFTAKYLIYDILIKDGIWQARKLTPEKMELAIISLSENLEVLQKELEQESNQLLEISNQLEEKYLETAIEQIDISKRN